MLLATWNRLSGKRHDELEDSQRRVFLVEKRNENIK